MKRYVKLFESYVNDEGVSSNDLRCDPIKLLDAFQNSNPDDLRWAAYHASDNGFDAAENMAEDSGEAMAVRALRGICSGTGVLVIPMLDVLETLRDRLDEVREVFSVLSRDATTGLSIKEVNDLIDFFERFDLLNLLKGDISWLPDDVQQRLKKRQRSIGAFGSF